MAGWLAILGIVLGAALFGSSFIVEQAALLGVGAVLLVASFLFGLISAQERSA